MVLESQNMESTIQHEKESENVINYNDGISIDHVMASGTVP